MKKYFFLFLMTILFQYPSSAQKQGQARIDSLLTQLPKVAEDSSKVNLLVDISFTYYSINPVEGIKMGE